MALDFPSSWRRGEPAIMKHPGIPTRHQHRGTPARSSPATREKCGLGFMNGSGALGMPHRRPGGPTARRKVAFLCLWSLLPAWPAWGDYKKLAVKVGPVEGYASRQSQGPVTIAADPFPSETRIRTVFDIKGLSKMGLVPINLIISNQGPDALSIDSASITLLDPEYGSLSALSPKEAVRMILRHKLGRPVDLSPVPPPWPPFGRGRSRVGKHIFEIEGRLYSKVAQAPHPTPRHGLGVCLLPASREPALERFSHDVPVGQL